MINIYFSIIALSIAILIIVYSNYQQAKHREKLSELRTKVLKIKLDMYKAHLDYLDHISKTLDELKNVHSSDNNTK